MGSRNTKGIMRQEYLNAIFLEKKQKGYKSVSLNVRELSEYLYPKLEEITIEMGCLVIGKESYIPIENVLSFTFI